MSETPKTTIYVGIHEYKYGTDISTYRTPEARDAARIAIAEDYWDEQMDGEARPDTPKEMADAYFEQVAEMGESYTTEDCELEG